MELPDEIVHSSGFGEGQDALFDPVDLIVYNLSLFVCDQTQNRLLQFDQRLNYVGEIVTWSKDHNQHLFPAQAALDPRGYILLYSAEYNSIWKGKITEPGFDQFINLDRETESLVCVKDMAVNERSELGLLYPCGQVFRIYSPLGRRLRTVKVEISDPVFLITLNTTWIVLNRNGQGQIWGPQGSKLFQVNSASDLILDVVPDNNDIILLFQDYLLRMGLNVE